MMVTATSAGAPTRAWMIDAFDVHLERAGVELETALAPVIERGAVLVDALIDGESGVAQARHLCGLGVGSTPAGDDYLIGVMHALWSSGRGRAAAELITGIEGRTTTESERWLRAAASGRSSPAWKRLLAALGGEEGAVTGAATAAVLGCGHTSGAASVLGFLTLTERSTERSTERAEGNV